MKISWLGPDEGVGAYPTINRNLTRALEARGHTILRDMHNYGYHLAPICVSCQYPPIFPMLPHAVNISCSTWEFDALPDAFQEALALFDLNVAMCEWVQGQYADASDVPADFIHLGVDPLEFKPRPRTPADTWFGSHDYLALWVGGTDKRHGLDIALEVAELLPDNYALAVHQYPSYPHQALPEGVFDTAGLPFTTLASLYVSADCLLHTARAVGFSLPVLEAMAMGLPVVTADLAPVMEFCPTPYTVPLRPSDPATERHHVHHEVAVSWCEGDAQQFADQVVAACQAPRPDPVLRTWNDVAADWESLLEEWS